MSDLLAAASLLLAVEAVLIGLWYSEIHQAQNMKVEKFRANRGHQIQVVADILISKTYPLAVSTSLLTLIFLPDAISLVLGSLVNLFANGRYAVWDYDAIQASFLLIELFFVAATVMSISWAYRLRRLGSELKEPDLS